MNDNQVSQGVDGQGSDILPIRDIEITVNNHKVIVKERRMSGLEIKQSAIQQGVRIGMDFVLSREVGGNHSRVVGDDDTVLMRAHLRFIAVAPDDNS